MATSSQLTPGIVVVLPGPWTRGQRQQHFDYDSGQASVQSRDWL